MGSIGMLSSLVVLLATAQTTQGGSCASMMTGRQDWTGNYLAYLGVPVSQTLTTYTLKFTTDVPLTNIWFYDGIINTATGTSFSVTPKSYFWGANAGSVLSLGFQLSYAGSVVPTFTYATLTANGVTSVVCSSSSAVVTTTTTTTTTKVPGSSTSSCSSLYTWYTSWVGQTRIIFNLPTGGAKAGSCLVRPGTNTIFSGGKSSASGNTILSCPVRRLQDPKSGRLLGPTIVCELLFDYIASTPLTLLTLEKLVNDVWIPVCGMPNTPDCTTMVASRTDLASTDAVISFPVKEAFSTYTLTLNTDVSLTNLTVWDTYVSSNSNASTFSLTPKSYFPGANPGGNLTLALQTSALRSWPAVITSITLSANGKSTLMCTQPIAPPPPPQPLGVGDIQGGCSSRRIVCYYPSWTYSRATAPYLVSNIPNLCTHVIYAFATLNPSTYTLQPFEPAFDVPNYQKFVGLKASMPGTKFMLGFGGYSNSEAVKGSYTTLLTTPNLRDNFVATALTFLRLHGFDGLDLNYINPSTAAEKAGYAALIAALRTAFAPIGWELTASVPAGKGTIDAGYDVATLAANLDAVHLMAYDMHGYWEKKVNHHAPLFGSPGDQLTVDWAVNYWLSLGMPRSKLVVGIPSFGRTFTLSSTTQTNIGSLAVSGGLPGPTTNEAGMLAYWETCANIRTGGWAMVQDRASRQGPYAFKGNQWVSYDDDEMAAVKAYYIINNNLGGAMIWDLASEDYSDKCGAGTYPIVNGVKRVFSTCTGLTQAAVLLGGTTRQVDSWPCNLNIPALPRDAGDRPGAAVLGSKVYLCGGQSGSVVTPSCLVLENNKWSTGPNMGIGRKYFTINAMDNKLVAAGGNLGSTLTAKVEILDNITSTWRTANWSLSAGREFHCAAALSETELLVAGGYFVNSQYSRKVEKYNIITGALTALRDLPVDMGAAACTVVSYSLVISSDNTVLALSLSSNTWTTKTSLTDSRRYHTMQVVNGKLMAFGGFQFGAATTVTRNRAEILNSTNWYPETLPARGNHAMVMLTCPSATAASTPITISTVLNKQAAVLLGGDNGVKTVESWPCNLNIPAMPREANMRPGAAVLGSSTYMCGGMTAGAYTSACNILANNAWSTGPSMVKARGQFTLNNVGNLLVAVGGFNGSAYISSVEIFYGINWQLAAWSLTSARSYHCTATLSTNEIIVAGGSSSTGFRTDVEKYNVGTGQVTRLASLPAGMRELACTVMNNKLVAAYYTSVIALDLSTNAWSTMPNFKNPRGYLTMAVLNGQLSIFGGYASVTTLEVLNGSTWYTGSMQARSNHAMVLLNCP